MPRLANSDYISKQYWLPQVWHYNRSTLSHLNAAQQSELQAFFVIDRLMSDHDLLAHRVRVTTADPSLPQRAGKAFARLNRLVAAAQEQPESTGRRRSTPRAVGAGRQLQIRSVRRPEPDLERLARAFIELSETLHKKDDRNAA